MNYSGYLTDKDGNKYFAGIVESGSNSNGNYIKFSDGTMIQSGTVNCNASSYGLITFPSAFSSPNVIMTANNIYNRSGELGLIITTQSDTTTVGVVYFRKYENDNDYIYQFFL